MGCYTAAACNASRRLGTRRADWGVRAFIVSAPAIGQTLGLSQRCKQLGVEEFISELAVVDNVERSSYDSA